MKQSTSEAIKKEGWIVVTPTMVGPSLSSILYLDRDIEPLIHPTEKSAYKELAGNIIDPLQEFIDDERDFEDTDFGSEDIVCPITWYKDDRIVVCDDFGNTILEKTIEEWRKSL